MATVILPCKKCKRHKFQDAAYGSKMRVHNETEKKPHEKFRCTVCGSLRGHGGA